MYAYYFQALLLFAVVLTVAQGQPIPDEPPNEHATQSANAVTPTTREFEWPVSRPIDAFAIVGCNLGPAQFQVTTSKDSGLANVVLNANHVALAAVDGTILTTTTVPTFVKCVPSSLLMPPCSHHGGCGGNPLQAQLLGYRTHPVSKKTQAVRMNLAVTGIASTASGLKISFSGINSKARKRLAGTSLASASLVLRLKSWECNNPYQLSWAALRTPSRFMLPTGTVKAFTTTSLLMERLTAVTAIGVDGIAHLYDLKSFSGLAGYHSWKTGGHHTTFSSPPTRSKQLHNVVSLRLREFFFINTTNSKGVMFTIDGVVSSTVKGLGMLGTFSSTEGRHLLQSSSGSTTGTTSVSSSPDPTCNCNATNYYASVNCTAVCGFGDGGGKYDSLHSECVVNDNACTPAADSPWSVYTDKSCPCQCCTNRDGGGQCSILANSGSGMYCGSIPTATNPMPPGPYSMGAPGYTGDVTIGYCTTCDLVSAACMDYPVCTGTTCNNGKCTKTNCNPPTATPASDAGCASLQCWCFGGNTANSQLCAGWTQLGLSLNLCDAPCQPKALGGSQNPPWFIDVNQGDEYQGVSLSCVGGTPSASDYDYDYGDYGPDKCL